MRSPTALLQGVCGGLQEMPRCVPGDEAVSIVTFCRIYGS
jgi:hypothetical protein